jgi:hypothetical protein
MVTTEKAVEYSQNSLVAYYRVDGGTGNHRVDILDDLADIGRITAGGETTYEPCPLALSREEYDKRKTAKKP